MKTIDREQVRTFVIQRSTIDEENRTVPAALSSELPVSRGWGNEVLVHSAEAINMERANAGLPLLFEHREPIGRIRDIKLETVGGDKKLRGTLHFSKNTRAAEVWQDVRDEFLPDVSISYRIDTWEEEANSDTVRITRWTPLEASVVSVPADHTVGINRQREKTMPDESKTPEQEQKSPSPETTVEQFRINRTKSIAEGKAEGQRLERERQTEIRSLFDFPAFDDPDFRSLCEACIDNGYTVAQTQRLLLDMVASGASPVIEPKAERQQEGSAFSMYQPVAKRGSGGRVEMGTTDIQKFMEGATKSILVRSQMDRDPEHIREVRQSEFHGVKLTRLAEHYLIRSGMQRIPYDERDLIGLALTRAGLHGTSDFANLLESISTHSVLAGWGEAPETWQTWCRIGSLPDFKTASRTGISEFSDLELVYENGEYKQGTISDLKEQITLLTYGKMFHISRQAIINDDLDQLTRTPMKMGRAASRKVGDLAYAILTANAALNQDSTAIFHANHSNYVASGSGAAPSVATINAAITAMATQTDPSGNAVINYSPRYLIVPKALEATGRTMQTATYDPAGTAGTLTPNTVANLFQTVADARLDQFLATGWYMAGDQQMTDTVEVAFLGGASEPYMEQQDPWAKDGVSYKVRIDAAAKALDFRALYYNYGA